MGLQVGSGRSKRRPTAVAALVALVAMLTCAGSLVVASSAADVTPPAAHRPPMAAEAPETLPPSSRPATAVDAATGTAAPATATPGTEAPGPEPGPMDPPAARLSLPVPTPPTVLRPFQAPSHAYGPGHRGVDLVVPESLEIRSAAAGVVVFAGDVAGRGVVSVEHVGGLRTTYEPVLASVAPGTGVAAGQVLGVLQTGHPGCAPAACLHWGARLPGRHYLDPLSLLAGWEVRLLPWVDPRP